MVLSCASRALGLTSHLGCGFPHRFWCPCSTSGRWPEVWQPYHASGLVMKQQMEFWLNIHTWTFFCQGTLARNFIGDWITRAPSKARVSTTRAAILLSWAKVLLTCWAFSDDRHCATNCISDHTASTWAAYPKAKLGGRWHLSVPIGAATPWWPQTVVLICI